MNSKALRTAAIGSLFIGIGVAFMLQATKQLKECVDCDEESPEITAEEVAKASAEVVASSDDE